MTQIITNSMPLGVPGDLSRQEAVVESANNSTSLPVTSYGLPVKRGAETHSVTGITTGDVGTAIIGFLVRDFPSQGGLLSNESFGAGTPPLKGPVGRLRQGYIVVRVNGAGTPADGSIVYTRVATPTGPQPLGGIEAAADGANTIVVPNATFTGAKDAEGNAEIRYNVGNSL